VAYRAAPNWEGSHNLQHHLWWHVALFKLRAGRACRRARTLRHALSQPRRATHGRISRRLYRRAERCGHALRLQRLGVDVGNRWEELADKAEARIGDCVSAFTLPHWMMALTATGRTAAAERMIEAMRASPCRGTVPPIVRDYVLPIAQATGACRRTSCRCCRADASGHRRMYRLGGSHAQQDVLEQLFVDAALDRRTADVRFALERIAGRRAIPPERFAGSRRGLGRGAGWGGRRRAGRRCRGWRRRLDRRRGCARRRWLGCRSFGTGDTAFNSVSALTQMPAHTLNICRNS
jgi:hypothetical protein